MRPGARGPGRDEHPGHRATRGIRHQPGHQRGEGGEARRRETPPQVPRHRHEARWQRRVCEHGGALPQRRVRHRRCSAASAPRRGPNRPWVTRQGDQRRDRRLCLAYSETADQSGIMSDESSAEDSADRAALQELRASHTDRDHVVETLRDAAAEGRLTPEELDERVERALGARTLRELAALTRDLPEQRANPSIPSTDVVKIEKRFGTAEWVGTWLVPRRMEIRLTVGNAKLDFTNAVITHDQLSIDVDLGIGGDLTLITKPGIVVVANDVIVRSMAEIKVRPPQQDPDFPVALRVEVTGQLRGGDLLVRYPKSIR
ncbi:MAG TPA: DUF1707 domain-containing protein [Streptosporangiaceae bacterium]|nr:DUF1707 domain-containing protein [Streptosporangiaceae bacterium]